MPYRHHRFISQSYKSIEIVEFSTTDVTFRKEYSSPYLLVLAFGVTPRSCVTDLFTWLVEKLFFYANRRAM